MTCLLHLTQDALSLVAMVNQFDVEELTTIRMSRMQREIVLNRHKTTNYHCHKCGKAEGHRKSESTHPRHECMCESCFRKEIVHPSFDAFHDA